jgi:hypothetical protein
MVGDGNADFEGREMRLTVLLIAILLASSGPALASNKSNRGQCRKLTKQMSVHAASMDAARAQRNVLWARSLDEQMMRMAQRRDRLCPDIAEDQAYQVLIERYEQTKQFLAAAGKTALSYFTFGAY